jgi:ABC-2 type transport system ATP-binding protein
VASGAHVPIMGAAPLDPPLPPGWTVEEYVTWSARLTGASQRQAKALALAALARVDLQSSRKKALSSLSPSERRVLALAQAAVATPEVIVAEAPLSGLAGAEAAFVLRALAAVIEGRRAIVSAARLDPSSPEGELARAASHLVVMAGGEVALEGPPGELFSGARIVSLAVRSGADELRSRLAARGIDLRGGPVRFSAALPPGATTREILAAAREASAAVVEMVPVIG